MVKIESPIAIDVYTSRRLPLSLGQIALNLLPLIFAVSLAGVALELMFPANPSVGLTVLIFWTILLALGIRVGLTGSLWQVGSRTPFSLRALFSVGLALLIPMVLPITLALPLGVGPVRIASLSTICGIIPLSLAIGGPWLAWQVVPEGPPSGGRFFGRFWRMAALGPIPIAVSLGFGFLAITSPFVSFASYWIGAALTALLIGVSSLTIVIYAWAITRTARTNAAEVFA